MYSLDPQSAQGILARYWNFRISSFFGYFLHNVFRTALFVEWQSELDVACQENANKYALASHPLTPLNVYMIYRRRPLGPNIEAYVYIFY